MGYESRVPEPLTIFHQCSRCKFLSEFGIRKRDYRKKEKRKRFRNFLAANRKRKKTTSKMDSNK